MGVAYKGFGLPHAPTSATAATVAFLVSQGAGYVTVQNIRIDGGLMRSI